MANYDNAKQLAEHLAIKEHKAYSIVRIKNGQWMIKPTEYLDRTTTDYNYYSRTDIDAQGNLHIVLVPDKFPKVKTKEYEETHQEGMISIENIPEELAVIVQATDEKFMRTGFIKGDLGVQIAKDGRIWICINGVAFLRFSPHPNGKMELEK